MEAYEVKFNIWADSQEEANELSDVFQQFINANGERGIAITASKTKEIVKKWQDSYVVKSSINQMYRR